MVVIGIDQHKHFSQVAVVDERGALIKETRIAHIDKKSIPQYLMPFKGNAKVAMESTGNWTWLCDILQEEGFDVHLSHPLKTRLICEARVKTDKIDARMLAQLLRANLLPESYIAPLEVRRDRQKLRYRMSLVRIRISLKNRVHGLLDKLGIIPPSFSDLFGIAGSKWLISLKLPDVYNENLKGYLALIDKVTILIDEVDRDLESSLEDSPQAKLLDTLPGIGTITAHLLAAEIGPIERFKSAKKLASYAGLVSSVHQSGMTSYTGPITKQGNRYIRWAMIEAAQRAYLKDPVLGAFYRKLAVRKGRSKALVALARKMLVIAYHILKNGSPYDVSGQLVERAGQYLH